MGAWTSAERQWLAGILAAPVVAVAVGLGIYTATADTHGCERLRLEAKIAAARGLVAQVPSRCS